MTPLKDKSSNARSPALVVSVTSSWLVLLGAECVRFEMNAGQLVQAAYPGDPAQVDGWQGSDPTAGLEALQADDEQHAKVST